VTSAQLGLLASSPRRPRRGCCAPSAQGAVAHERKLLATDLLADIRALDRQLANLGKRLDTALVQHGTSLTDMGGVGTVLV
jgi:hypothetical protein